jgi:hypothetical protein
MFAQVYFDGVTSGALSYEDMMDDIVALMTGETDVNNLSVATLGDSGHINTTLPAGWALESKDSTTTAGYIYYILSALVEGSSTRKKFIMIYLQLSNGRYYFSSGDAVSTASPTTRLYFTLTEKVVPPITNSGDQYLSQTSAYYVYLQCQREGYMMMFGEGARYTFSSFERERNSDYPGDLPDSDMPCMALFRGPANTFNNYHNNYPVPNPYTDDPDSFLTVYSSGEFTTGSPTIGLVSAYHNWFVSNGAAPALRVEQSDGSTPMIFTQPLMVSGRVILGKLLPNFKVYRYQPDNTISNIPGQEVVLQDSGGETLGVYCVFAPQWGVTTATPFLVEKR